MVTFPDSEREDSVNISVLLRLLVVMLTSPPFPSPNLFFLNENVCIVSFSSLSEVGFILLAFSFMSPPFLELPFSEYE